MTPSKLNEAVAAFPRRRVAALAGVSDRRLDYWEKTGLISPSVDRRVTPHRTTRIYDYGDALSVLIIVELRARDISLQHIRQVIAHLRSRKFEPSEVVFAIAGARVHFQLPSGEWEDVVEPNQIVLHEVLNLEPIRARVRDSVRRSSHSVGKIERRRGALGSKKLIAGTRIAVESVRAYIDRGFDSESILAAYPDLSRDDVEAVRQLDSA
jgi:DNA-binding transcriptional MerR regulator